MTPLDISLTLPEGWFALPRASASDQELVDWALATAGEAWSLRVAAGATEESVAPGAQERLVLELGGLAYNVREQVDTGQGHYAAVWVPAPELGVVTAVVIVQSAPRSAERSLDRFADALQELTEQSAEGYPHLFTQRLEGEVAAGPVRGLHSMLGVPETSTGTAALEERTSFGVFPPELPEAMVEVHFIAEKPTAFGDMPSETLDLLASLEVRSRSAA